MNDVQKDLKFQELLFLKKEQRYIENKLNIVGIVITSVNSISFLAVTNFFQLGIFNFVSLTLPLLAPLLSFLLGLLSRKTMFFKKDQHNFESKYNIYSPYREEWADENILEQIMYQRDLAIKIIKRKNLWINLTIMFEFIAIAGVFAVVITITT